MVIASWVRTRRASRQDLETGEPRRSQIIGEVIIGFRGKLDAHPLEKNWDMYYGELVIRVKSRAS